MIVHLDALIFIGVVLLLCALCYRIGQRTNPKCRCHDPTLHPDVGGVVDGFRVSDADSPRSHVEVTGGTIQEFLTDEQIRQWRARLLKQKEGDSGKNG